MKHHRTVSLTILITPRRWRLSCYPGAGLQKKSLNFLCPFPLLLSLLKFLCDVPSLARIFAQQAPSCLPWFLRFGTSVPCLNALLKIHTKKMRKNKNKPTASMLNRGADWSVQGKHLLGILSFNSFFGRVTWWSDTWFVTPKTAADQVTQKEPATPPSSMWHPTIPITQLIPNKIPVLHGCQRVCSERQNHSCLQHQHILYKFKQAWSQKLAELM